MEDNLVSKKMSKQEVINGDLLIATKDGKILRIPIDDIPLTTLLDKNGKQKSRKPTGVKLIDLKPNDEVVKIATTRK